MWRRCVGQHTEREGSCVQAGGTAAVHTPLQYRWKSAGLVEKVDCGDLQYWPKETKKSN